MNKRIIGALNYMVLILAQKFAEITAKTKIDTSISKNPFLENFLFFNTVNDFSEKKLNLLLFFVLTANKNYQKNLINFFGPPASKDRYFAPVKDWGIVNQYLRSFMKSEDVSLLFKSGIHQTNLNIWKLESIKSEKELEEFILENYFLKSNEKHDRELLFMIKSGIEHLCSAGLLEKHEVVLLKKQQTSVPFIVFKKSFFRKDKKINEKVIEEFFELIKDVEFIWAN